MSIRQGIYVKGESIVLMVGIKKFGHEGLRRINAYASTLNPIMHNVISPIFKIAHGEDLRYLFSLIKLYWDHPEFEHEAMYSFYEFLWKRRPDLAELVLRRFPDLLKSKQILRSVRIESIDMPVSSRYMVAAICGLATRVKADLSIGLFGSTGICKPRFDLHVAKVLVNKFGKDAFLDFFNNDTLNYEMHMSIFQEDHEMFRFFTETLGMRDSYIRSKYFRKVFTYHALFTMNHDDDEVDYHDQDYYTKRGITDLEMIKILASKRRAKSDEELVERLKAFVCSVCDKLTLVNNGVLIFSLDKKLLVRAGFDAACKLGFKNDFFTWFCTKFGFTKHDVAESHCSWDLYNKMIRAKNYVLFDVLIETMGFTLDDFSRCYRDAYEAADAGFMNRFKALGLTNEKLKRVLGLSCLPTKVVQRRRHSE